MRPHNIWKYLKKYPPPMISYIAPLPEVPVSDIAPPPCAPLAPHDKNHDYRLVAHKNPPFEKYSLEIWGGGGKILKKFWNFFNLKETLKRPF